ncbi:MAG: hypothetical protein ACWA49_01465 [Ruegeria sp.]
MTRSARRFLPFALSLLLVLTAQGVAASRGLSAAVGQMVLCTGTGPVVVYMDSEGQPTKAPHFCPDYAINLLGAALTDQPPHPSAPARVQPLPPRRAADLVAAPVPQQPARSPPMSV